MWEGIHIFFGTCSTDLADFSGAWLTFGQSLSVYAVADILMLAPSSNYKDSDTTTILVKYWFPNPPPYLTGATVDADERGVT